MPPLNAERNEFLKLIQGKRMNVRTMSTGRIAQPGTRWDRGVPVASPDRSPQTRHLSRRIRSHECGSSSLKRATDLKPTSNRIVTTQPGASFSENPPVFGIDGAGRVSFRDHAPGLLYRTDAASVPIPVLLRVWLLCGMAR